MHILNCEEPVSKGESQTLISIASGSKCSKYQGSYYLEVVYVIAMYFTVEQAP